MKQLFYGFAATLCLLVGLSGCNASTRPVNPGPNDSASGTNIVSNILPDAEMDDGEKDMTEADHAPETSQAAVPNNTSPVEGDEPANTEVLTDQDGILEISPITTLEPGFSSASFSGDDGFEAFLAQGGASSDADVTQFLMTKLLADVSVNASAFGCSTLTMGSPDGHQLFGRNFDWQTCDALEPV